MAELSDDEKVWTCALCDHQERGERGFVRMHLHAMQVHPGVDFRACMYPDRLRILEKVTKLVELAGSPNEEEARTAAKLACDLIRQHEFKISMF